MSDARFEQAYEIFTAAVELEGEARAAYLAKACGDDAELKAEVEGLLGSGEDLAASRFLEPNLIPLAQDLVEEGASARFVGTHLGAYRIEEQIGSGGMGNVYRAVRQTDYTQQVAIKLIKLGLDSEDSLQRFRNEMRFLATVEKHPNVASLLDAGTTEDGLPYFIMEYVEGLAIDEYCNENRLGVRERLELFRAVCGAVQFAHQNAVIHRDLKPTNILVTVEGVPKLIDFGIAKLTSAAVAPGSADATQTGYRALTPHYASPEQVRGDAITTATDVYSLGVVLYELLAGVRPYRLDSNRLWEIEKLICEHEPQRPSVAAAAAKGASPIEVAVENASVVSQDVDRRDTQARLRRELSGDLDNIVMMALRKEPLRRYQSVQEFSADVGRYLDGRPVRASKDTVRYRAVKFVRRNKIAVAVLLLVLLSILGGTVGTATQAIRASRNATRAQAAADRTSLEADRANQEAVRANEQARVAEENLTRARQAEREAQQVAGFMVGLFRGSDPIAFGGYEFGAPPKEDAELTARGMVAQGAEQIVEQLGDQPLIQAKLIDTIGDVYVHLGDLNTGSEFVERALDLRRQYLESPHVDLAESIHNLGWLRYVQGRYDESERLLREAIAMRSDLLGTSSKETTLSKFMLAWVLLETDFTTEVEELLSAVVAARQSNAEGNERDIAYAYAGLALVMIHKGETDMALEHVQQAMQLLSDSGDESLEVFTLAVQGMLQAQIGNTEGAVQMFRQALEMAFEVVGETHPAVIQLEVELAKFLIQLGDLDAAESTYRNALKRAEQSIGRQPRLAETLFELGDIKRDQRMLDEAETLYRRALDIQQQYLSDEHPHTAYSRSALAALSFSRGERSEAESMFQSAVSALQNRLGENTYQQIYPLCGLAVLANVQGDTQAANRHFEEAERIGIAVTSNESAPRRLQFVANDLASFGGMLIELADFPSAERVLRLALTLRRAAISDDDWRIAQVQNDLGACLTALDRYEDSEAALVPSHEILNAKFGQGDERTQTAVDRLVALYNAWGRQDRAAEIRSRQQP